MHLPDVASSPAAVTSLQAVAGVMLLGVRVTAYAVINVAEHRRREATGMGAVLQPALLDRLLDQPAGVPVIDPAGWAEMAGQAPGILERDSDGVSVTRRLESPLSIADVVVQTAAGRELRAVQDASLFAGFTRRWVAAARSRVPDAAMLEAKVCGVGILDPGRRVLLAAEKPVALTRDGWSWLLEEKVYRRWLGGRPRIRVEVKPLAEPA
ncbi:MAG TPA: hypothetical protein VKG61_13395 [Streptosporangiaceae bacterium]|nr:hypothetical protein [Streptosporangiaceae bacterium]